MPKGGDTSNGSVKESFSRLLKNKRYVFGVIALFFYEGVQIGVWSFTIRLVMQELGILEVNAATYYLIGIICFSAARFLFTWLMKWHRPSKLLKLAAIAGLVLCTIVVVTPGTGMLNVVALTGISFFMSLMFPTIYGLALENVDSDDKKIGASGLIMAILGGAVITPLQGVISDAAGIHISYIVPLVCLCVVLSYACYIEKIQKN